MIAITKGRTASPIIPIIEGIALPFVLIRRKTKAAKAKRRAKAKENVYRGLSARRTTLI